jgi:hypothetical protein
VLSAKTINAREIVETLNQITKKLLGDLPVKNASFNKEDVHEGGIKNVIRAWLNNVSSDVVVVVAIEHNYYFGCAPHMRDGYGTVACVQLDVGTDKVHEMDKAKQKQICTLLELKVVFADSTLLNGIYTDEMSINLSPK